MRIVVNGQQAFGADVLKALLERGEEQLDRPGVGGLPLRGGVERYATAQSEHMNLRDEGCASRGP